MRGNAPLQPEGLQQSSRGLSAQRDTPESSHRIRLAPFQGANSMPSFSGGLRFASTPATFLQPFGLRNGEQNSLISLTKSAVLANV